VQTVARTVPRWPGRQKAKETRGKTHQCQSRMTYHPGNRIQVHLGQSVDRPSIIQSGDRDRRR